MTSLLDDDVVEFWERRIAVNAKDLKTAWHELPRSSFSIWIILHTFTQRNLAKGKKYLAKKLGMSESQFNRIVKNLENLGYIEISRRSNRGRSRVKIVAKANIDGPNHFVK